jgi:hypothetical protein
MANAKINCESNSGSGAGSCRVVQSIGRQLRTLFSGRTPHLRASASSTRKHRLNPRHTPTLLCSLPTCQLNRQLTLPPGGSPVLDLYQSLLVRGRVPPSPITYQQKFTRRREPANIAGKRSPCKLGVIITRWADATGSVQP